MNETVTVEIDHKSYEIDLEVFRRLVVTAQGVLMRLKKEEGRMFPEVDSKALKLIFKLQFNHKELI